MAKDVLAKVHAGVTPFGWATAEIPVQVTGSRIRLGGPLVRKWGVHDIAGEAFVCAGFFRHAGELVCSPVADGHHGQHWLDLRTDLLEAAAKLSVEGDKSYLPPETGLLVAPTRIVEFDARWTSGRIQLDLKVGQAITSRLGYDGKSTNIFAVTWGGHLVLMSTACYMQAIESEI